MKYKYQFEYEFRKIINFIKVKKEKNGEDLLANIYKLIASNKDNISEEDIFINSIINDDTSAIEIALTYYMSTPINFSFAWIKDNIKSYSDFYNIDIDTPNINSYKDLKSYILSIRSESIKLQDTKNIKSKAIYHSIIKALEDAERKINQLTQISDDVIEVIEAYCNSLAKDLLVSNNMIDKITKILEEEKLVDIDKLDGFESKKEYINEFKNYTKKHNQNVMIDRGFKEVVDKEKPYGIIEWNDDYDMEDFVDVYWNRIKTFNADLIKYMLPQNDFPRYDEFLNLLINKFDESTLKDDLVNKKYNVLKDISIKK